MISDLKAGRYVLAAEHVDLAEATSSCFLEVQLDALDAGVDLVHQVPSGLTTCQLDRRTIDLILAGLVLNGIERTRPGGKVTVTAGGRPPNVWLGVIDTGEGIERDELAYLLRANHRRDETPSAIMAELDDTTLTRLALARALVELQGGVLEIHTIKGKGTTVMCCLPHPSKLAAS